MRNRLADMIDDYGKPKRSKGTQLLRDAALGHEEFPPPAKDGSMGNMTATEINIRMEYANRAAAAIAKQMDNHILDSLKYQIKGV